MGSIYRRKWKDKNGNIKEGKILWIKYYDRSGKPWNTGRLLITANNIHNNSRYDLTLGEKQLWDLDVTGNWWGSRDPQSIQQGIFDKTTDPELGKALFMPYAERRFDNAGITEMENAQ